MFLVPVQERWNYPDCQLVAWAPDKNGDIRIMKLECEKMEPVDVAFDFKWQAYDVRH